MIKGKYVYEVFAALVPLYVAMILGYGSVKWWKIFTPDQCSGINRFVAVFAVPLLSFHFISANNLYEMNYRFIAADSLQKLVILVLLFLWQAIGKHGGIDWMITLFSLSTLPNTLVMGIPLLKAMYGEFTATLMVQIVVLQSVIWYTVLLFLFEYRGATILIAEQFPETAAAISSFRVDSDVVSLSGSEPLETNAMIDDDGNFHVVLRRSNVSSSMVSSFNKSQYGLNSVNSITPRASNLTGVEIYSVQSSRDPTPRPSSSFNQADFNAMLSNNNASSPKHGCTNSFQGIINDVYSVATPRPSNFEEEILKVGKRSRSSIYQQLHPMFTKSVSDAPRKKEDKELHMFVWSSSVSSVSDGHIKQAVNSRAGSTDFGAIDTHNIAVHHETSASRGSELRHGSKKPQMPPASVMTRLILIMVWRKLIRNPNTYASILGLVWSLISFRWHVEMPSIVRGSISILSDTGLGMAMFSLGLFMALQPKTIACGKLLAIVAMAVRFLIGPAVVAATSLAIGIRGVMLHVAIVQAALPQGIVPFVFAKEYNVHADILSTAVIFGMMIALPITIIYYVLLGF